MSAGLAKEGLADHPAQADERAAGAPGYSRPRPGSAPTRLDPKDEENDGLLLEKGGPTTTNSSAFAELHNVKGITLTELGYDIRKLGAGSAIGSHCGAGAPRFNVCTTDGILFFIGCVSPPADFSTSASPGTGDAWTRLRWGTGTAGSVMGFCVNPPPSTSSLACPANFTLVPITGTVQRAFVVFDEGTNTGGGPDQFGVAFLDDIANRQLA